MSSDDIAALIDHTVLGPDTTVADVRAGLEEAIEYGMNFATYPCYVPTIRERSRDVTVVAPVGFPHGQHASEVKRTEARTAVEEGADEIDVVINVGTVQTGDRDGAVEDLRAVTEAVSVPVKVIIESPLLSEDEIRLACQAAVDVDADFVKTATGFAGGGATVPDVKLMSEYLPVKASGGIGSWREAKAMLDAGAERIGSSSGKTIVRQYRDSERR
ncbi:deoxyribose-phosphate aldolase [Halorubrum sp. CBA1125]|uniref:deoxyribose-phosphate aldolase n=1 Tax=Halorubrum sp. CBA1125 TaxID=2668072 RepID=UPI00135E7DEA|nr:deoxyribose-phosphate aldolase [Halorubrum sp. CBA1125]MUW14902.1 deoxyribose-phosphate aldolase [Halorubrum sp. CBA1125]